MICSNCKVKIGSEFAHALKNNICPGCGKNIMDQGKLLAYNKLKNIISDHFPNIDYAGISDLIIANFDISPHPEGFVEENKTTPQEVSDKENDDTAAAAAAAATTEAAPNMSEDEAFDKQYKEKQIEEGKEMLKKIREEAYEDALRAQWGMGDEESGEVEGPGDLFDIGLSDNPIVSANLMKMDHKRNNSYDRMISGEGKVRRSS